MSDYWRKVLANPAPSSPPSQQPPAGQQSQPWWRTQFVPRPAPANGQQAAQQQPQQPQGYEQAPTTSPAAPSKAISARVTEHCPNCGSTNYFRPSGMLNAMQQCYECGHNPRFDQQAGASGLPSDATGPAQPARQVAAAHQGYSGEVVGHVS